MQGEPLSLSSSLASLLLWSQLFFWQEGSTSTCRSKKKKNRKPLIFISRGSNPVTAHDQAIALIDNIVRREAFVMAFNDGFYFVGIALLLSGLTLLFCKKVKPGSGAAAH